MAEAEPAVKPAALDREHYHVDCERGPQHAAIGTILAPGDVLLKMIVTATARAYDCWA